jgi:hypothetical protein
LEAISEERVVMQVISDEQLTGQQRRDLYETLHFYKDNRNERHNRLKTYIKQYGLIHSRSRIANIVVYYDDDEEGIIHVYNQSGLTRVIKVKSPFGEG